MSIIQSIKGSLNVITGSGSGLGRATLEWFLRNGSGPVLAIDRKFDSNFEKELNLSDELKSKITLKKHNTFEESQIDLCVSEFVKKYGRIDNLINVAGVNLSYVTYSAGKDRVYDLSHADNLIKFNTVGTFNMIRLIAKHMIKDNIKNPNNGTTKCIINTSTTSTTHPNPSQNISVGSFSAIDSMTLCVARELSSHNIRCNTINVGYFETKLLTSSDERVVNHIATEMSLCPKRIGRPAEFAHLVQTIVENQMLNGCCIKLDAGIRCVL